MTFGPARTIAAGIGGVTLLTALVLFQQSNPLPPMMEAAAQDRAKPAEKPLHYLIEAGPERSGGLVPFVGNLSIWGRKTTHADARTEYSIRLEFGNFVHVLMQDVIVDFIEFATKIKDGGKSYDVQKPADETSICWRCRDEDGQLVTFFWQPKEKTWLVRGHPAKNLLEAMEEALKDIEAMKATKPRTPW